MPPQFGLVQTVATPNGLVTLAGVLVAVASDAVIGKKKDVDLEDSVPLTVDFAMISVDSQKA